MDDNSKDAAAAIDKAHRGRSRTAQLRTWIAALGVVEELRSLDYPLTRILIDVPATALGLASLYGLADVVQNGAAYTPLRSGGPGHVTAGESLLLYLLSIGGMGMAVATWLFVFFQDEP